MLYDEHLEEHVIGHAPRNYLQAIDLHLDLLSRVTERSKHGEFLRRWIGLWFESVIISPQVKNMRLLMEAEAPADGETTPEGFVIALENTLNKAETYHIDSNMMGFISDIADSMPEDYSVDSVEMMPSPHGFMHLEIPIQVNDRWGIEYLVRVINWSVGTEGFSITEWTLDTEDAEFNKVVEENRAAGIPLYPPRIIPLHSDVLRFGEHLKSPQAWAAKNPEGRDHPAFHSMLGNLWTRRFVAAAWAVMHGKIGRPRRGVPSKRQQKGYKRRDFDWGDIRIVELRRTEYEGTPPARDKVGREVQWTHRWSVAPFWRWQWYPSEPGPCPHCGKENGVHRRIFIDAYVKGPDHLPYIAKDRLYVVKR